MNIHTPTTSPTMSGGPRGHFGRKLLIAGGTGVVLVAVAAGVVSSRSDRHEAATPAVLAPAAIQQSSAPFGGINRASGGYTPHTIYIVGSEEQAALVQAALEDANGILVGINERPIHDEVIVAVSADEGSFAFAAEIAANEIVFAQYGVENRIVDLRG